MDFNKFKDIYRRCEDRGMVGHEIIDLMKREGIDEGLLKDFLVRMKDSPNPPHFFEHKFWSFLFHLFAGLYLAFLLYFVVGWVYVGAYLSRWEDLKELLSENLILHGKVIVSLLGSLWLYYWSVRKQRFILFIGAIALLGLGYYFLLNESFYNPLEGSSMQLKNFMLALNP